MTHVSKYDSIVQQIDLLNYENQIIKATFTFTQVTHSKYVCVFSFLLRCSRVSLMELINKIYCTTEKSSLIV